MTSRNLLEQIMQSITEKSSRSSGVLPAAISGTSKEVAPAIHRLDYSNSDVRECVPIVIDDLKSAGRGMSDFDLKSLVVGDVVMIALIAAAMQFNLIPTFEIDLKAVTQQEIIHAISTTGQPERLTKKVYPTLSFTDSRKELSITFSVVTIFEEMVIYAAKSLLNVAKTISALKSDSKRSLPIKKRNMISTLYLNPSDFIFSSLVDKKEDKVGGFHSDSESHEMTDDDFLRDERFMQDRKTAYMDVTNDNGMFFEMKNNTPTSISQKTQKSNNRSVKNGLSKELIGCFAVHFYELTSRISTTLLRPLLFENSEGGAAITVLPGALSLSILSYLKSRDLCRVGLTCRSFNCDYSNDTLWVDLLQKDYPPETLRIKSEGEMIFEAYIDRIYNLKVVNEITNYKNTAKKITVKLNEYKGKKIHKDLEKLRCEKIEQERMREGRQRFTNHQPPPFSHNPPPFTPEVMPPFTPGFLGGQSRFPPRHFQRSRFDDDYTILPHFDRFGNN